ncbi:family S53 protease [Hymenopellis radicata]|nr:family S53 protease [Hymenopellis radicata]
MMKLISLSTALIAFVLVVSGNPVPRAMRVHDRREVVPPGFAAAEMASSDALLHLHIVLAAQNMDGLQSVLMSISTPGSPSYGKYLSLDQVKEYTSPTDESVTAVKAWLAEHNVTNVAVTGAYQDRLSISVPAGIANNLFYSEFRNFVDLDSGERIIRTQEYSIPEELKSHIAFVHPTTSFAKPQFGPTAPAFSIPVPNYNVTELANPAPANCNEYITPGCLQALYGIPTSRATQSSNTMGVTGFLDQYANEADLTQFLEYFRQDVNPNTSFKVQSVDGGMNSQNIDEAGLEAVRNLLPFIAEDDPRISQNLDIQYTVGVATGVPVTFVSVGRQSSDGVGGFLDVFNVLISQDVPPTKNNVQPSFQPSLPAVLGKLPSHPQQRWILKLLPSPDYQKSAISTYFTTLGPTYSGLYNASGRGFPDVAAQGEKIVIGYRGEFALVEGTSASCPIFASVISLINDRLIAAGKPVLGFLNPFIYANRQAFFDITAGSNPGCGTNGFPATAGWNAVTGMGTPNFSALLKAAGL